MGTKYRYQHCGRNHVDMILSTVGATILVLVLVLLLIYSATSDADLSIDSGSLIIWGEERAVALTRLTRLQLNVLVHDIFDAPFRSTFGIFALHGLSLSVLDYFLHDIVQNGESIVVVCEWYRGWRWCPQIFFHYFKFLVQQHRGIFDSKYFV